ncbi:hypothetical protein [Sphingomonas sp. M1-B02]|nr:hypothetical protein [Sphingomonas sp. S6-11]UZK67362.1 hypothetical protein OKW87_05895 [Sphingomonas sp. S6-11]
MRGPRASDAIERSLRNVYVRDIELPEDMLSLLRELDRDIGSAH